MALIIKWSKKVDKDIEKIIGYLENEWNEKVAGDFVKKVYTAELISLFPLMGSIIYRNKNIRGILISEHTRLYYRIKNTSVIILKLFDTRKNPKSLKF
ncbi:MAG: type II toxin-antitoxin system RelE/ParE family toxin [bacterium]